MDEQNLEFVPEVIEKCGSGLSAAMATGQT